MRKMSICPICGSRDLSTVTNKKEIIEIKNEKIEVLNGYVYECSNCKESFTTFSNEDELINEARKIYRERHNIPSPSDIKTFLAKYNLSYRDFEKLTGIGTKTLDRYLKGAIPDPSNIKLLLLIINEDETVIDLMKMEQYFKNKTKFSNILKEPILVPGAGKKDKLKTRKNNPWKEEEQKWRTTHKKPTKYLLAA